MFTLDNLTKVKEGHYTAQSKPCPQCMARLTVSIEGTSLFKYNQGGLIQDVLPHLDTHDRERFITGYCKTCWDSIFKAPAEIKED